MSTDIPQHVAVRSRRISQDEQAEQHHKHFAQILQRVRAADKTLQTLDLEHHYLTTQHVQALIQTLHHNYIVLTLNLEANEIDDDVATSLASMLANNDTLLTIYLEGNRIGDKGAIALATELMKSNGTLLRLDLSENKVGVMGLRALAKAVVKRPDLNVEVNDDDNTLSTFVEALQ